MAHESTAKERTWRPDFPCNMPQTLRVHRRGSGDPTYRIDDSGTHWRGLRTPEGDATLAVSQRLGSGAGAGEVHARAWGPGADWALDRLPRMLGCDDDVTTFRAERHEVVADLWRRFSSIRFGASDQVWSALLPSILEQKVTGKEAFGGYRALVYRHGEPAPGPAGEALRLFVPPTAAVVRMIPSWEWTRLHVDPKRARTAVTAARVADAMERTVGLAEAEVDKRLRTIPGVGVWTSAEVRQRAHGHADAVSFFDYHVAKNIGWALTKCEEDLDDDGLAVLLEPFRPHRARVQRLVETAGLHRPRRGARMSLPTHFPSTPGRYA